MFIDWRTHLCYTYKLLSGPVFEDEKLKMKIKLKIYESTYSFVINIAVNIH